MSIYISPNYKNSDFKEFTLNDKINVFSDRVFGWIFKVCRQMIEKNLEHRGFALLKIVFSSFEMLGKHIEGYEGQKESKKHFIIGVQEIFEGLPLNAAKLLYSYMRNYLYHSGFLCTNVVLYDDIDGSWGYDEKNNLIINVDRFVIQVNNGFVNYFGKLRDSKNFVLRENFEKRFNYDHKHLIDNSLEE